MRTFSSTCRKSKTFASMKISILIPFLTNFPSFLFREMVKFIFINALIDVTLYKQDVIEITDDSFKLKSSKFNHESLIGSHSGEKRTLNRILDSNYTWQNMRNDVKSFINSCVVCATSKVIKNTKIPLCLTSSTDKPFFKIYLDTVGKLLLTERGNTYILTVKDDFSKFVFAIPIKDQTSEEIAHALMQNVFLIVGFADIIVVDNATVFNSSLFKELCKHGIM